MSYTTKRFILGSAYMLAMGSCGIILVAIGSSLDGLAELAGSSGVGVGGVFISRGVGSISGAILSAKMYSSFSGNIVITSALILVVLLLSILPCNRSVIGLHILFLLLGLQTSIIDTGKFRINKLDFVRTDGILFATGCQILTRKLHGKNAGPWLGANTVAFGLSASLVPLLEIYVTNMVTQYVIISIYILFVASIIAFNIFSESPSSVTHTDQIIVREIQLLTDPIDESRQGHYDAVDQLSLSIPASGMDEVDANIDAIDITPPHYHVEILIASMAFCFIGGSVAATAYVETYIDDMKVIDSEKEANLLLVFWIAITIGRLLGVQDQRFINNDALVSHLAILCICGILATTLISLFPHSGLALWVGVTAFGLCHGPCIGYCYDLNNR